MMSNDLTDAVVDGGYLSGDVTSRVPGVRCVFGLKYDSSDRGHRSARRNALPGRRGRWCDNRHCQLES